MGVFPKTISGVVTSATDSEPLIGVSVQVRETATGGITDIDGRYSVSAQQGQTLVFSYIGYQSQEIKVGTSSVINVVLKEDTEMLDEVVVVGYGVQKKKLVTGATVQVKGDEIAKVGVSSFIALLCWLLISRQSEFSFFGNPYGFSRYRVGKF